MEYMCFNQRGDISTLKGGLLKLVEVIWNSDLTDKIKQFFPSIGHVNTAIWMHYMDANKTYGDKAWWQLHKNAASNIEPVLEATPHEKAAVSLLEK